MAEAWMASKLLFQTFLVLAFTSLAQQLVLHWVQEVL
jgi:hypothetical protein